MDTALALKTRLVALRAEYDAAIDAALRARAEIARAQGELLELARAQNGRGRADGALIHSASPGPRR